MNGGLYRQSWWYLWCRLLLKKMKRKMLSHGCGGGGLNYLLKCEVSGVVLLKMEDKVDLESNVWGRRSELFVEI